MSILKLFRQVKAFVFDVDGVLAKEILVTHQNGGMERSMNSKDGYALQLAVKKGYGVCIISSGHSAGVQQRLENLGIKDIFLGTTDKKQRLVEFAQRNKLDLSDILYMGDDMPDYLAMKEAGLPCCPADAVQEVKTISKYISAVRGGEGCGREVIEKTLKLNGHWDLDTAVFSA